MAQIERFEDIHGWKSGRELCTLIYKLTNNLLFAKDYALKDQIRRAVVSITSNIAEGFERGGNKEFIQFLFIAKASCGEVRSQLYVALDCGYISNEEFEFAKNKAIETSKIISGFITYLKGSDYDGSKFSELEVEYFINVPNELEEKN